MRLSLIRFGLLIAAITSAPAQPQSQYLSIRVLTPGGSYGWPHAQVELQEVSILGTIPLMHVKAETDLQGVARFRLDTIAVTRFRVLSVGYPYLCSSDTFLRDKIMSDGVIAERRECGSPISTTIHAKPGELVVFAQGADF